MRTMWCAFLAGACTAAPSIDKADDTSASADTDTDTAPDVGEDATFRVALLADPHVIGDAYECCESAGLDTQSIYRTRGRFQSVLDQLRDVVPSPDFGLVAGDVFHANYKYPTLASYLDPEVGSASFRAKEIIDTSPIPLDLAWGNHDYPGAGEGRELAHQVFDAQFDTAPYHSRVHKGWRFIYLNTQLGPTWDPSDPMDAFLGSGGGSLGREQLAWLASELEQGEPAILVMHHHPLVETLVKNEDPDGPWPDVYKVIEVHADRVKGMFFGHLHRWVDVESYFMGVPAWIIGGIRYDADNFWIAELEVGGESWEIVDYDKAVFGTPNGLGAEYSEMGVLIDYLTPAEDDPAGPWPPGDDPPPWPPE